MRLQESHSLQMPAADGYSTSGVHIDGYTVQASFTSSPFFIGRAKMYCLAIFSDSTANATVKVQASLDKPKLRDEYPDTNLINWFDLTFYDKSTGAPVTTQTVSGTTPVTFEEVEASYRWIRVVWTNSSGTPVTTIRIQFKGVA